MKKILKSINYAQVKQSVQCAGKRHPFIVRGIIVYTIYALLTAPVPNPFPQDPITIRGTFPFDQGLKLEFGSEAISTATWASKVCGFFVSSQGIPCREDRIFRAKQTVGNNYEITLYRDYFLSGLAGWRTGGMAYSVSGKSAQVLGYASLPWSVTRIECNRTPVSDGSLTCVSHRDETNTSIFAKTTKQARIDFGLVSSFKPYK